MAAKTPRFGLNLFGGDADGSLADDGGKYTAEDRATIDRLLAALETHDHGGGERLEDPSGAPTAVLDTSGGTLAAGTTYHYTVTYVDAYGLESGRSDEVSVTTPDPVAIPQNVGLATAAGGTLDPGLYQYAVTAHKGAGETPLSPISTVTVRDWQTVNVTFTVPAGADQISVWRQGPTESGFTRLATVGVGTSPFVDDGSIPAEPCPCDAENLPPSSNTTGADSRVTVTAPSGDLEQPTLAKRWRIYRTTTPGAYSSSSLLAEVSDTTTDGGSQLVEEYLDDGTVATSSGQPPLQSKTLLPSQELAPPPPSAGGRTTMLRSPDDTVWQITATPDGALSTTAVAVGPNPQLFADEGVTLVAPDDAEWRLTVGDDGVLTTTETPHAAGEASYAYGQGPDLPTFDGAVTFRLGITADGELVTYGDRTPTAIEGVGVRRLIVSETEPTAPREGDVWLYIA